MGQVTVARAAVAVAIALGEDWKIDGRWADPNTWRSILLGPNGMSLIVLGRGKRLVISGGYPAGYAGSGGTMPEIGCAAERSSEEIAADVVRRLMPKYALAFAEVKAHIDEAEARRVAVLAARDRLLAAVPEARAYGSERDGYFAFGYGDIDGKVLSPERVLFMRLSCTVEQAIKVLQVLADEAEEQPEAEAEAGVA